MLQHFYDEFMTFVPMQLPKLLDVTEVEEVRYDDYILLTFPLKNASTIEEVMDTFEDDIQLIMLYHHIPSRQTDYGRSCCAYSNPSFGMMFKMNAQTADNGMVKRIDVTLYGSLEVMCADLTIDVELHSRSGFFKYRRRKEDMILDFL